MIVFRNECYEMRLLKCILYVCSVLQCFLSKGLKITSSFRLFLGETVIYLPSQCSRLEWPRHTQKRGQNSKKKMVHLEVVCQLTDTVHLNWVMQFETHFLDRIPCTFKLLQFYSVPCNALCWWRYIWFCLSLKSV